MSYRGNDEMRSEIGTRLAAFNVYIQIRVALYRHESRSIPKLHGEKP